MAHKEKKSVPQTKRVGQGHPKYPRTDRPKLEKTRGSEVVYKEAQKK